MGESSIHLQNWVVYEVTKLHSLKKRQKKTREIEAAQRGIEGVPGFGSPTLLQRCWLCSPGWRVPVPLQVESFEGGEGMLCYGWLMLHVYSHVVVYDYFFSVHDFFCKGKWFHSGKNIGEMIEFDQVTQAPSICWLRRVGLRDALKWWEPSGSGGGCVQDCWSVKDVTAWSSL